MLFFVALRSIFLCSCSIHLTLQVIKKTLNLTYLCTCFNTSQYLVSLNTLQQTIRKTLKQNRISKTIHCGFCITENKMVGFCCWYFVWFFFPPRNVRAQLWSLGFDIKETSMQCMIIYHISASQPHKCPQVFIQYSHGFIINYHIRLKYYKFTLLLFTPLGNEVNLKKIMLYYGRKSWYSWEKF